MEADDGHSFPAQIHFLCASPKNGLLESTGI